MSRNIFFRVDCCNGGYGATALCVRIYAPAAGSEGCNGGCTRYQLNFIGQQIFISQRDATVSAKAFNLNKSLKLEK